MDTGFADKTSRAETLACTALEIAKGQLGQSEKPAGSNSGPMVNEYLRAAGLKPGYPWCQAFVYWCYEEAAKWLGIQNPLLRTAGVHDCWNRTSAGKHIVKIPKANALLHPEQIGPGDQVILFLSDAEGHTGIVEAVKGNLLYTIEGNSNKNGSREGYEVVRHTRNLDDKVLQGLIKYL